MKAARTANAVHVRKTWLRTRSFVISHEGFNIGVSLRALSRYVPSGRGSVVPGMYNFRGHPRVALFLNQRRDGAALPPGAAQHHIHRVNDTCFLIGKRPNRDSKRVT